MKLTDPDPNLWTIINIVIAIVIMIITLYFQRTKKSLVYRILTETQLFSVDDEIKERLQITLDGVAVQGVHLVLIKIWNNGKASVIKSDFDDTPIIFSFSKHTKILNAKIIDKNPEILQPNLTLMLPNQFAIDPLLLNERDSFTIKLLAAEYVGNNISLHYRINGVKEIKRVSSIFDSIDFRYSFLGLVLMIVAISVSAWLYPEWLSNGIKSIILLIVVVVLGSISFIANFRQAFDNK